MDETRSLRAEELDATESHPYLKVSQPTPYEPDLAAYAVDEANDPYRRFTASVESGATIQLRVACRDGRREILDLSNIEARAWIRDPLEDRTAFVNAKISERRATVALKAARRLTAAGKTVVDRKDVKPDEEAFMLEFGLAQEALVPLQEGGYAKKLQLREDNLGRARARASLREDGFWDGGFDDAAGVGYDAPTEREYLPRGGPMGQQQLISDIWDAQAKSFFAWTHDPAVRFAIELLSDFTLGRSFSIIAASDKVQPIIDEFVNRELLPQSQQSVTPWGPGRITNRLHDMATSLWRDGELFLRKFSMGDGRIKVRSLPPETIWEIVTDAEDPLEVFYYTQRYQTRVILFAPPNLEPAKAKWIERTIARDEMIHVLINAKESDARGRGDPFASLGWAKRLRDYFDAMIQKQFAQAAYQWWIQADGGTGDLQRLAGTAIPSEKPRPGSYFMTNKAVEIKSISSDIRGAVSGEGTAYDALLNHVALAFGLNKSYFGVDSHANRATALVATEPTAKHLETRQDLIIAFLTKLMGDVITEAVKFGQVPSGEDLSFKVQLPSIIKADATTRGTMIRQAEGMAYVSKQTAAETFCAEAEIPDYDFDGEQQKIKDELGNDQDPSKLILKDMEMVAKGQPLANQAAWAPGDVPNPAYAPPSNGASNGHSNGVVAKPTTPDPHDASPTSGAGAAAIRNELGHGGPGDKSTMASEAAFREYAKKHNLVVIYPD
jgi:hypothetical protein